MWGVVLVLIGALLLGQQLNWFGPMQLSFAVFLFGIPALMFLLTYTFDRRQWWALIPGCILLGLAGVVFNESNRYASGLFSGAIFLFSIALPFWLIYLIKRWWWAIIPAGVMTVLSIMPIISNDMLQGQFVGGIFFLGLAATFALVRLATRSDPNMGWAWWPAAILGIFGALTILLGTASIAQYIWPIGLIVLGGWLLFRNFARSKAVGSTPLNRGVGCS
jgi:peptidoglycan/LPS O-acetylase OafA/YrhL